MFEVIKRAAKALRKAPTEAARVLRKVPQAIESLFGGLLAGVPTARLEDYESYLQAGSKKCWALYKASSTIAKVAMDTPWQVEKKTGGDGQAVTPPADLAALLESPNEWENFCELKYKTADHLTLTGNAFWVKDQANVKGDRPKRLFSANPKRMRIVLDTNGMIKGYLYKPSGGVEIPFDMAEIIHFKIPHPNNDYWGLGVVEAGEDLFQDFINRQNWGSQFWTNGASPAGILVCEEQITDEKAFEEAKLKWQKQYGGSANSGKTAWLTGKWRFEKIGLTSSEMQNVETTKLTVAQIFMQCGVPLSVAGVEGAANYATAWVDDLRFRRYTVKPMLTFIQDTMTSDLIAGYNPNLKLVFSIAGLIDVANIAQNYAPLFDRAILSINEMRAMLNLPLVKNNPLFDGHYLNAGLVPIELAGIGATQPQTDMAARSITQRFVERGLLLDPARNGD